MLTVTMAEIARRAGVDQSTVSLALRNSGRISQEMRKKIHDLAEEMGYRPNPLVSALMRNRRKRFEEGGVSVVAWVSSWPTRDGWQAGPIFRDFFEGAARRLAEHGFKLEHFWFDKKSMTASRFSDILVARGITSLIIAPMPFNDPELELDWDKFSATTIGRSLRKPSLDRADAAHFEGVATAIKYCKQLGYRAIGLVIKQSLIERFERRWLAGYLVNAPEDEQDKIREVFIESIHEPGSVRKFCAWFKKNKPDVIITVSRWDGLRLIELLEKNLGKSVPGDIGVVTLSCHSKDDEMSGIFQFPQMLGAQAAEILVRKTMLNETGLPEHPMTYSLNGMWNQGRTLRSQIPGAEAERGPMPRLVAHPGQATVEEMAEQ